MREISEIFSPSYTANKNLISCYTYSGGIWKQRIPQFLRFFTIFWNAFCAVFSLSLSLYMLYARPISILMPISIKLEIKSRNKRKIYCKTSDLLLLRGCSCFISVSLSLCLSLSLSPTLTAKGCCCTTAAAATVPNETKRKQKMRKKTKWKHSANARQKRPKQKTEETTATTTTRFPDSRGSSRAVSSWMKWCVYKKYILCSST